MTTDQPVGLTPRSTTRGRPRTTGVVTCARCHRAAGKARTRWPEGPICGTCFYRATRTHGTCPTCGEDRLLPGPPTEDGAPTCGPCAGIVQDFHCTRCGHEGEFYRRGRLCARCALREDLTAELVTPAAEPELMRRLVDALCAAERPESELGGLGPQRRVLGLQSADLLLRRLTFGRRGVLLRRPGLQWARGQRPVSSGLLAGPVDLEPTPQRATHDAEVLGDAADRGARSGLVQVDGLTTELLGIVLPSHDSRIISLPQHHVLDSACPRTGVRPHHHLPPDRRQQRLGGVHAPART